MSSCSTTTTVNFQTTARKLSRSRIETETACTKTLQKLLINSLLVFFKLQGASFSDIHKVSYRDNCQRPASKFKLLENKLKKMDTYPWPDCRDIRNRSKSYSFSILDEMCDYYCYPNNPTHLPPLDSNLEPLQHLPLEPQSLEIMECLTHSKDQCGVFRVSALVEGKRQQAILKLVRSNSRWPSFRILTMIHT